MEILERYSKRSTIKNDGIRDRRVNAARKKLMRHFESDPSYFKVTGLEPDNPNPMEKRLRVINESVLRQLNPERIYSKYAIPHPEETMVSGTILFGIYQEDYLVTAITGLGDVHQQCTLQKLNQMIGYRDKEGNIQAVPAVVNGVSRVGDGVEVANLISMADELVKIRLQENIQTRALERDMRLRIANKMYTITKIDTYTDENVINIIAREDLVEDSDSELDPTLPITPPADDPVLSTKISGADTIVRAKSYTYMAPKPGVLQWNLQGGVNNVKIMSYDSQQVVIRAEKTELIEFELIATYPNNEVYKKKIRIVSLLGG